MKKSLFSTICLSLMLTTLSYGQTPSLTPCTQYPSATNYTSASIDNDNKISNGVLLSVDAWINGDVMVGTNHTLASGPAYIPQTHLAIPASITAPYYPQYVEGVAVSENGNYVVVIYRAVDPNTGSANYYRAVLGSTLPVGSTPISFAINSITQINATNFIGLEADNLGNVYYAYMAGNQLNITHSEINSGIWNNHLSVANFPSTINSEGELSFSSVDGSPNFNVIHVAMANNTGAKVESFLHNGGAITNVASSPLLSIDITTLYHEWDMIDISAPEYFDQTIPSGLTDQYVIAFPHQGRVKTYSPLTGVSTIVSTPTQSSFNGAVELEYQDACNKGYTLGIYFSNSNPEVSVELDQNGICVSPVYKNIFHGPDTHGRNFSLAGKHSDYLSVGLVDARILYKNSKCIASNWRTAQPETELNQDFFIYPNPVNDVFTLEEENINFNKEITISNMLGQVILRQLPTNTINISNLPSGNYILKVYSNTGQLLSHKLSKL